MRARSARLHLQVPHNPPPDRDGTTLWLRQSLRLLYLYRLNLDQSHPVFQHRLYQSKQVHRHQPYLTNRPLDHTIRHPRSVIWMISVPRTSRIHLPCHRILETLTTLVTFQISHRPHRPLNLQRRQIHLQAMNLHISLHLTCSYHHRRRLPLDLLTSRIKFRLRQGLVKATLPVDPSITRRR